VAFFLLSQRRMTRVRATWPALLGAAFLVAGTAAAQVKTADLANATLEELMNIPVTTATRATETLANAPARMHVITAEQIRIRGYRSLMELLEDLPDFKVDLAGDQDYPTELTVQGTRGANRVIVLMDGIRVSSPTNEPLPILANYPLHAAKQIEIVYGPASALYGADAFSGVINIISRNGKESPGLAVTTATGQDGLYNQSASYGTPLGKNGSLLIGGQFFYDRQPDLSKVYPRDFNGLQGQRTGTFNTIFGPMQSPMPASRDYEAPISAWSFQTLFERGGTQLSLFANSARVPTSPAYTPDNAVYDDAAFNDNDLLVISGSHTRAIRRVMSTSSVSFSRHELDPQSGYWNVFSNMTKSYKYAYGSMLKFDEQLVWKPAVNMTLVGGATFERFFAIPQGADLSAPITSHDAPGTILGTNIPDEFVKLRYSNTGAYAQWQYTVTQHLAITAGARGDYNTRYGGTFNPRVGLVLNTDTATTLKLLYGTAYLAPSPYEAYSHYGSFYTTDGGATYASDYWHVPNPDLRPQQKKTVEANVLQPLGESFVASASVFHSWLTDLRLSADPDQAYSGFYLGWPVAYIDFAVNEGSARTYGATLALDFATSFASNRRVMARGALSLADGRVESDVTPGEAMRRIPIGGMSPVEARFGADIEWGRWTVAPRLAISGRQRVQALELVDEDVVRKTLDGYTLVDVNIRRREVFTHVDLFLTIDNALDARYRHINARAYTNPEELIGAPQNPRRVTLGVDIRVP
jgi:outer membrane cobalamin receptor